MKTCSACDRQQPLTQFYRDSRTKDGLQGRCRACYKAYNKSRYAKDPTANSRWQRKYRKDFPERVLAQRLLREYGLSLSRYRDLLAAQSERCAICGAVEPGGQGGWHVDHDHLTLVIRGLLCHACNTGLGLLGDSTAALHRAIQYLNQNANIQPTFKTRKYNQVI